MSMSIGMNRYFPGIFRSLMRATVYKDIPKEIVNLTNTEEVVE